MKIGGLQKLTLIDYPKKTAATIFVSGCNFRCGFCYNPELVLPEKIKKHPLISEKKLYDFLSQRKGMLQGVCITGGEPTIYSDLPKFISNIKNMGFLVKLDTNGSNPEMLEKLIEEKLVDYVAMDIKAPLSPNFQFSISNFQSISNPQFLKYEKAAGVKVDLNKIKKSVEILKSSNIEHEFRTTVVPGTHTKEDVIQIAKDINPAKKYYLQNFEPKKSTINPDFQNIKPYSEDFLIEIQKAIKHFFEICEIR